MITIDENTEKSDQASTGGYAAVAQPKPEFPDLVPNKPEIDHTDIDGVNRKELEPGTIYMGNNEGGRKSDDSQNAPEYDQTKPGRVPPQQEVDASKDGAQRQGGDPGQQNQHHDPAPSGP
jgi:hypothetical protein